MKLRNIRQFSIWKKQMLLICRIQSGALKIYIQMDMDGLKDSVVRMLAGEAVPIHIGTFSNDMTTSATKDDVLTLLVHLGYLTYNSIDETVSIPNKEVSKEYVNAISTMNWHGVADLPMYA